MKDIVRVLTAEFVGTFAFVFIGAGVVVIDLARSNAIGVVGIALAHGFAYAIFVTATMNISGGHLNPATTFALWLTKKLDAKMAGLYVASQILAAVVAVLCVKFVLPDMAGLHSDYGAPQVSGLIGDTQAVLVEALLTFFLVCAVFGTLVSTEAPKVGGFGVGLVLVFALIVGGPMTGGMLNPARAFGPALVSGNWQGHLIYWVGPLLGAAAAAGVWGWVLLPRKTEENG
ncbi:MAG: aquaporin [Gemmatimonadales bacterium]|jgi:aquaporin Z